MILIKYILKKIYKNQLIILMLLFLVCFCQKLIKFLGLDNTIPIYIIFSYLILNLPELGKLIIPFSLFLSVLITCYQLHIHNEILVMYSCAINKYVFIQSVFFYSIFIFFIAILNIGWLSPYCEQYRYNMLFEVRKNVDIIKLIEKKFQLLSDIDTVLFIDNIKNKTLKCVFIIKKKQDKSNNKIRIVTASQGDVYDCSNNCKLITLKSGVYYEIYDSKNMDSTQVHITNFSQYHTSIDYNFKLFKKNNVIVSCMFINQLFDFSIPEIYIELNWRLTILISIFIMPIIALLLMITNSYNYICSFLLSVILYVLFFMLHIMLRSYFILDQTKIVILMWIINIVYVVFILLINLWESFRLKIFKIIFMFLFKK